MRPNDPWMFHQANTRDYGGGRSLLGDLLGATIDRYKASGTFPILSGTPNQLREHAQEFNVPVQVIDLAPGESVS